MPLRSAPLFTTAHDPRIPTVIPAQLLEEVERRGGDGLALARRFDLPATVTEQPFVTLPLSRMKAFAEAAAELAGDDHLGLHAGENGRSNILRVLAFACSGARTGREALEMFVRYVSTIHDALTYTLIPQRDGVKLRLKLAGHPECLGRHGNEHWVASCLVAAEQIVGIRRVPGHVWLAHEAPRSRKELVRVLATSNITFDAGYDAILFTKEQLDAGAALAGSHEGDALVRYSSRTGLLPPAPTAFITRLREAIEVKLSSGAPSIGEVARSLGMSGRTLQRRLAEEGQTFFEVLDGLRRDIALVHVERRDLSLAEIAARVGYSQKSAFFRSFRRWTGKTPRRLEAEAVDEGGAEPAGVRE